MLEHAKENTNEGDDIALQEVLELMSNMFEWRVIAERVIQPKDVIKMIKKPSKNGQHQNPYTTKNTKFNESCFIAHAMKKIKKDT